MFANACQYHNQASFSFHSQDIISLVVIQLDLVFPFHSQIVIKAFYSQDIRQLFDLTLYYCLQKLATVCKRLSIQ